MAPGFIRMAKDGIRIAPGCVEDGPKVAQDYPGCIQNFLRIALGYTQDGPRIAQDATRMAPGLSKMHPECPQDCARMHPGWPQDCP
jgi:hypothetical protein